MMNQDKQTEERAAFEALALVRQALAGDDEALANALGQSWVERAQQLVALSSAPAQEPMWRPIETAPKDGTLLLLWEEHEDEPFIGFWYEHRARWVASTTHYDTDGNACVIDRVWSEGVAHWMPLPTAPGITKE